MLTSERPRPIDLYDREGVRQRAPFLIAHRGGVIGPGRPENSLAAIRVAADEGYAMVELDVEVARDGVPVLFHRDSSGTLRQACGVEATIGDLTSAELRAVRYRATDQHIPTLDEALALCAALGLGVMLDVKVERTTTELLDQVAGAIERHGLTAAAMTISNDPGVRQRLAGTVMLLATREEQRRVLAGEPLALEGRFWFGLPERLPSEAVAPLKRSGALVVPAVNLIRYPVHAHQQLARDDVARLLAAGVDAFQIDSIYRDLFTR